MFLFLTLVMIISRSHACPWRPLSGLRFRWLPSSRFRVTLGCSWWVALQDSVPRSDARYFPGNHAWFIPLCIGILDSGRLLWRRDFGTSPSPIFATNERGLQDGEVPHRLLHYMYVVRFGFCGGVHWYFVFLLPAVLFPWVQSQTMVITVGFNL